MNPGLSQVVGPDGDWQAQLSSNPAAFRSQCAQALEQGKVLYFPETEFDLAPSERALLRPELADPARRNISLSADGASLSGVLGDATAKRGIQMLIARYQAYARQLVENLVPEYRPHLRPEPTSLRLHPSSIASGRGRRTIAAFMWMRFLPDPITACGSSGSLPTLIRLAYLAYGVSASRSSSLCAGSSQASPRKGRAAPGSSKSCESRSRGAPGTII